MAQPNNHAVGVDNTFRRKLDRGEYLGRACEREQKDAVGWSKSKSKGPPVQRKPLKHRDYEVDLKSRLGKTQAGYFCSVCKCVVKDSPNYLDHINGKKHQRALGMSMRVERASLQQVQERFQHLKTRKDTGSFTEQDFDEQILKQQQEEEERKRQRRERKKEKISSSSVNGSSLDRLTYINKNCRRCNKKATIRISETDRNKNKLFYSCNDCGGFVGWCLSINPEYRGHQIPREEVPTVGE
ncbi:zinc finger matrin-type protein 2-like isoform X2 [Camellia sinensis]|uniref:zinc finger matrin-type protein 2-like isoform X2 n=1 Tax=Camellia sinensis TaxID=4442 RepID=UPI00103607B1|nr:zinc finger matrin-type protein 2-like isoform X2 [Camellia sinensis]